MLITRPIKNNLQTSEEILSKKFLSLCGARSNSGVGFRCVTLMRLPVSVLVI